MWRKEDRDEKKEETKIHVSFLSFLFFTEDVHSEYSLVRSFVVRISYSLEWMFSNLSYWVIFFSTSFPKIRLKIICNENVLVIELVYSMTNLRDMFSSLAMLMRKEGREREASNEHFTRKKNQEGKRWERRRETIGWVKSIVTLTSFQLVGSISDPIWLLILQYESTRVSSISVSYFNFQWINILSLSDTIIALRLFFPSQQNAALHAVMIVIDGLDEETIRKTVIPKTKQVFESNPSVQVIMKGTHTYSCVIAYLEFMNFFLLINIHP